jgi:hypothetical protein
VATTEQKQFLKQLENLANGLRQEIEAKQQGLDPSPAAILQRRKRVLSGDFKFFAYNYFPHHIWGEPSVFQAEFCELFPRLLLNKEGSRDWWVAPRGESKSTLLTKIGTVYVAVLALLQQDDVLNETGLSKPAFIDYCILFGAETKFPTKLLTVIKTELEFNPALKLDFPEVVGKTDIWKVAEIKTKSGVTFEPRGAEQAVRGAFSGSSRPKLLLGDDLITDSEAKSPTECRNRWDWLEKSVDYLGPPDGTVKFMAVGTTLSNNDPISKARQSIGHRVHIYKAIIQEPERMDLWDECEVIMRNQDGKVSSIEESKLPSFKFYKKHKTQMDKGAVTSWRNVRTLYWLMRQRAKNRNAFNTEMQANPRSDEDKVFSDIKFWVNRLSKWIPYGACDPSMGKSAKSDPSSIIVGLWDKENQRLHIDHCETKRRVMSKLEADLIKAQQEYNCIKWAFENNNAYDAMRVAIIDSAMRKGVAMPMIGITNTIGQDLLIDSIEPFVNDIEAKILLHSKLVGLLDELDTYPEKQQNHHYDGLTGLGLLWQIVGNSRLASMPIIQSTGLKQNLFKRY